MVGAAPLGNAKQQRVPLRRLRCALRYQRREPPKNALLMGRNETYLTCPACTEPAAE